MTAFEFVHVHASGRFDADVADVKADWDAFRASKSVKLITGTEHGSGDHDAAFIADGWDYFRGDGECVASWATDTFELAWRGHADRIGSPFFRGGNHSAQTPLTCVPLRHLATRRLLMVRVPHTPAHIQQGDRFRRTTARVIAQAAAWASSLAVMGRRARRFSRNHQDAAQIVVGDWNVDLHRKHWRTVVRTALRLRCAWANRLPNGGSLGRRLIDAAFIRLLEVRAARVLPRGKGSDHHPIAYRYRITSKENTR